MLYNAHLMQQTLSIQAYWIHFLGLGLLGLLSGMVLIYLARRGKRTGDHPFCAQCHYDLAGIIDSADTCPECGNTLAVKRAITRGHRKTRVGLMVIGLSLFLAGSSWMAITSYHAYHKVNWYHYKPTSWLVTDAMSEYKGKSQPNLDELLIRLNANQLTDEQCKAIVPEILKLHASTVIWNDVQFKRLLGDLLASRAFTQIQIEQLFRQNYSATLLMRPVIRRERGFRYDSQEMFPELGWGASIQFVTTQMGRSLLLNGHVYSKSEYEPSAGYKASDIHSSVGSTQNLRKPFLKEIANGPARFEKTVQRTVQLVKPIKSEPFVIQCTVGQDVKIVGKDEWVDTFEVKEDQIKPMNDAWVASRVIAKQRDTQVWVRFDSPPVALAMGVWLIDGEKHEKMGNLLVDGLAADQWYRIKRYATMKLSDQVRIELRPDQTASDTQMMLGAYWGQTLFRESVPVNGPYVPSFDMDTSIASQLEKTVTINRLMRDSDNTLSFFISARKPPKRVAYYPVGPIQLQSEMDMNAHPADSLSVQFIVEFDPGMKTIYVRLEPNPQWERFGKLDVLPTGLTMLFENIPVPQTEELMDKTWHGKVIIPENATQD